MANIDISALVATQKSTRKILFAEGCDPDGYSNHQVIIPMSVLTEQDIANIADGKLGSWSQSCLKSSSDQINLGEFEARLYAHIELDDVVIAVRKINLNAVVNDDGSIDATVQN